MVMTAPEVGICGIPATNWPRNVVLLKSFGNVAMTPQLLAAAGKFAALAARRFEPSRDGSQVCALSHKLFC
jgi:hypothetical protein